MPSTRSVLVVDDEPDIRQTIARLIQSKGFATLSAAGGQEAIEQLRGRRVDLLILDIMMPGMDGFQTLERIRKLGHEDLPVVMLTARSEEKDVMKGYRVGADYYLTKPFRNERLLNIVDFLIADLSPERRDQLERQL